MSGPRDDGPIDAPGDPSSPPAETATIAEAKPPSRRDAIVRIGIVAGVLFVVFGLILPRFIDYQQVIESLQGLTIQDVLVVSVFGLIAWVLTGAIFTALIPGLGIIRGLQAYLILTGIGASIPLGPWNMAVLWVVIRGWGRTAFLASSLRASGSRRAHASRTPTASKLAINAEPPYDTSGSGTPAIGSSRSTTARLINACTMNHTVIPPAA